MRRTILILALLTIALLLLAACAQSAKPQPTPTPTAEAETVNAEGETEHGELSPEAAAGLETFRAVGCAGCHGQNGEGGVGPALAGHTEEQVFRQVRNPKGDIMPAFSEDVLSDEDVKNIAAWIDSLGDEMVMEHDEGDAPELSMTEQGHLRLILDSLGAQNQRDAVHHAQHLVDDAGPEVKPLAEKLLADLQEGAHDDVATEVDELLGGDLDQEFDVIGVHLGMALSAAQRGDDADVEHHLESAVLAAANHDHQKDIQKLLDDWRQGEDRHAVIDALYEALDLVHQD